VIASLFIDREGRLRSGWRFLLAIITLFGAFFVTDVLGRSVSANIALQNMINRPVAAAIMFLVFLWMSRNLDHAPDPAEYIGLGLDRRWRRDFGGGLLLGATLVSACVGVIAIVGGFHFEAGPPLTVSRWTGVAVVAWIFFFGAILEELGFRSYPFYRLIESLANLASLLPFQAIKDRGKSVGAWSAILLLGGLFGAVHLANPNATFWGFANTVLIGVFFGLLMVRTGSLWLLWGLHLGWNFTLGALYGLPVSGLNQFSVLWIGRPGGPTWLTGGAYGIEASATATMAILLALIVLIRLPAGAYSKATSGIQAE
jgi:hypothetical protein